MKNWKIIAIFFAGMLTMMMLLRWQGNSLFSSESPNGIVSLELSNGKTQTTNIIRAWESKELKTTARNNILLDFLFIPFYGLFLYSVCGYFCIGQNEPWQRAGMLLAFGSLVAMVLDGFENILMLMSLYGWISVFISFLTFAFASLKFSLIILAVVYIILSSIFKIIQKATQTR
ncbi:MAG: hypothetical protein C5B52_11460 [Bacteroidetes bacterium]|nr:MAG: hypothetical protein C5B52_11460 [Bacteroidota bacterium]